MRLLIAIVVAVLLATAPARADDAASAMPQMKMNGWFERAVAQFEAEASSDIAMAPDVWSALGREWRSFDRAGSAGGVVVDIGWVALATIVALFAERLIARLVGRRPRRRIRRRTEGPRLLDLLGLVGADIAGLAGFYTVFAAAQRHAFPATGMSLALSLFSAAVLVRWRVTVLVIRAILRPADAAARLIEIADGEAHRLGRFLSATILAIILLVGFSRYGLMDADSGAPHVIGLLDAVLVCGLYVLILFRTRAAAEALIRGRRTGGLIAAARGGLAQGWMAIGLALIAGLFVFFVAGLSLGLLAYYHAMVSTIGIAFMLIVLERLTERVWRDSDAPGQPEVLLRIRTAHNLVRAAGCAVAAWMIARVWIAAVDNGRGAAAEGMHSAEAAIGTLFVAFVVWELIRLMIDRHLPGTGGGPSLPGVDDDDAGAPASRLRTILPLLRAAFAVSIGIVAALIVLSRLGVDTAPLIAGAGVFGLAISFGSQSLVRDIISGLFYMWDDAFRVGEYIDTGRLKGTVETLGIRSVKLRHQNGPLHTIPYGQLGAVTNLSRDFATIKFNLRFAPGTDIELVRRATKQLGLAMQVDNPELAAEIILPLKLQGVAEIADNAVVLRFKFTARPVKPSWVQREYLKRLVAVFAEKGIAFASGPTLVLQVPPRDALPGAAPGVLAVRRAPAGEETALAEPAAS